MRIRLSVIATACSIGFIAGCGGGGDNNAAPHKITTQILSDSSFDGDIQQTAPDSYTVTQGMSPSVQSVFTGIDPADGSEFRAFLDFPLTGSGGVPGDAAIDSATLEIYIDNLQPTTGSLPIRIDLLTFQPPTLIGTDYDTVVQPALATIIVSPNFSSSDVGTLTAIDVTSLMVQAQRQRLGDFQLRVMENLGPAIPVLMVIDDSTGANRTSRAPLLTVTYF